MRLAKPDTEPLREVEIEPHPLTVFQRVMDNVDVTRGEYAELVVDLLPLQPNERTKFRHRQRRAEIESFARATKGSAGGGFMKLLTTDLTNPGGSDGIGVPRNEAARLLGKADVEEVLHRVSVPTALFYIQMLMRVTSYDKERAHAHLWAIVAAVELWTGRNEFELVKTDFRMTYIGSDAPPRRWWFDYRMAWARFGPLRHRGARVVSFEDVVGFITPPPERRPTPPPPETPPQPVVRPVPDHTTPLAPAVAVDDTAIVAVNDLLDRDGQLLLYGIGRRGATVDRMAGRLLARACATGAGAVLLEADARDERDGAPLWSRLARVEMPLLGDTTQPAAGWNPVLPTAEGAPVDRTAVAVRALTAAARCDDAGQAAALIDAAVRTLGALVSFLPHELAPTIFQVARLIADTRWRDAVLPVVDAPTRRFWFDVLPGLDREVVRRVVDLVRRLAKDPVAVALFGQAETTYDPYARLAEGDTVVLTGGEAQLDDVVAALLWFDASNAARALATAGFERTSVLLGTAVHRYGHDREDLFAHDLAATVQGGTHVLLLTDRPDLHDIDMRRAIRGLATAVAVDTVDAGLAVAAQWVGVGGESDLRATLDALDVDECLVVTARDGWRPRPVDALRGSRRPSSATEPAVGAPAGATLRQTRERLDGLEGRIVDHLSSPGPAAAEPAPGPEEPVEPAMTPNVIPLDPSRRRRKPRE
jgi:hypothetical protein